MAEKEKISIERELVSIAVLSNEKERVERLSKIFEKTLEEGNREEIKKIGEILLRRLDQAIKETITDTKEKLNSASLGAEFILSETKTLEAEGVAYGIEKAIESMNYLTELIKFKEKISSKSEEESIVKHTKDAIESTIENVRAELGFAQENLVMIYYNNRRMANSREFQLLDQTINVAFENVNYIKDWIKLKDRVEKEVKEEKQEKLSIRELFDELI
jgi:hypothetical protein